MGSGTSKWEPPRCSQVDIKRSEDYSRCTANNTIIKKFIDNIEKIATDPVADVSEIWVNAEDYKDEEPLLYGIRQTNILNEAILQDNWEIVERILNILHNKKADIYAVHKYVQEDLWGFEYVQPQTTCSYPMSGGFTDSNGVGVGPRKCDGPDSYHDLWNSSPLKEYILSLWIQECKLRSEKQSPKGAHVTKTANTEKSQPPVKTQSPPLQKTGVSKSTKTKTSQTHVRDHGAPMDSLDDKIHHRILRLMIPPDKVDSFIFSSLTLSRIKLFDDPYIDNSSSWRTHITNLFHFQRKKDPKNTTRREVMPTHPRKSKIKTEEVGLQYDQEFQDKLVMIIKQENEPYSKPDTCRICLKKRR